MNLRTLIAPILGSSMVLAFGACSDPASPPQNRSPVILSLVAFPEVVSASDSVLVACQAMDADSDTLVYDWITDSRLRLQGVRHGQHSLYNTHESFMIFYPDVIYAPVDTAWIQCFARDRRGMSAAQIVHVVIRS